MARLRGGTDSGETGGPSRGNDGTRVRGSSHEAGSKRSTRQTERAASLLAGTRLSARSPPDPSPSPLPRSGWRGEGEGERLYAEGETTLDGPDSKQEKESNRTAIDRPVSDPVSRGDCLSVPPGRRRTGADRRGPGYCGVPCALPRLHAHYRSRRSARRDHPARH